LLSTAVISNWAVFHKHSLGGDTATRIGLYARRCHAFIVLAYMCERHYS